MSICKIPKFTSRHSANVTQRERPYTKPNLRHFPLSKQLGLKVEHSTTASGILPPAKPNLRCSLTKEQLGLEVALVTSTDGILSLTKPNLRCSNYVSLLFEGGRRLGSTNGRRPLIKV